MTRATLLHLARFRRWLEAQPDNKTVGYAVCEGHCPIAMHLRSYFDARHVHVTQESIVARVYIDHQTTRTVVKQRSTDWAKRFIRLVDTQAKNAPISAAQALAMLNEAC